MVTDRQVRMLKRLLQSETSLLSAAAKAGMDEKTARKYRELGKLPSELELARTWRTRTDPFEEVWEGLVPFLSENPGLEAKTLFDALQREKPGDFADGQLRTLQRRVKAWRATHGPAREVFFAQRYRPGELSQSDFTHMGSLGVTIGGQVFDHLLYHFVLAYSNWETVRICFSESFESLSEGLQAALWELGGVPADHRTDRMSAAVHQMPNPEEFTRRYQGLLDHYGIRGQRIQAGKANENGDVEQSHRGLKRAVDQALMLRGSRDFDERPEYAKFLVGLVRQRNAGRRNRFEEEVAVLGRLPRRRLDASRRLTVRVSSGSTIRVLRNTYSVPSRLIGEQVRVRLKAEELEVWYGQRQVETLPRLRGEAKHRIDYRHVIEWLARKPGAFANYRYREDLFPSSRFRMAYDALVERTPARASREYVNILKLAAEESETRVDAILGRMLAAGETINADVVETLLGVGETAPGVQDVAIEMTDLRTYDGLLEVAGEGSWHPAQS